MAFAAAGTLVALQTTANVSAVSEVKASRTLTVGALPAELEVITIGSCVVTFLTTTLLTVDETNCADSIATIDRDLGPTDTLRTPTEIADVLDSLISVSDLTHEALTVTADTMTTTVFTTAGTETSATDITLLPSANITATTTVTGVIPVAAVAQVVTFTVAGSSSIDQDLFRATVNGTDYDYTVSNVDTDTTVASALATAIDANPSVVCTSIVNIVTCTATPAGTALTGFAATRLQDPSAALNTAKSAESSLVAANYVSYAAVTTALGLPETTNAEIVAKTTALNSAITGLVTVLSVAKTTAHIALTTARALYMDVNYTTGNLITLNGFKTAGDIAIDAATNLTSVTAAQTVATTGMAGVDGAAPIVTLSGSATLTLAFGAVYAELGARWVDGVDGSGAATVSGTVNTGIAGVYVLSYKKTDLAGNMSNVVTRTVTVSPAPVSSGGGGGGSSSYIPPVVLTAATGSTQSGSTATGSTQSGSTVAQLVVVTPSSNPNIAQDTFVKKGVDSKKSKTFTTTSTLTRGTQVNIYRILPNGKIIKVGTTRVLSNGKIRFVTKIAGTYKLEQKQTQ